MPSSGSLGSMSSKRSESGAPSSRTTQAFTPGKATAGGKLGAVDRMTFWWRLRSMVGATLAGFGWRRSRYSTLRLVRVPPRPWWWRLRHPFSPPMPPPLPADFKPPPMPPWFGAPESELGEALPLRAVLASDVGVAVALVSCVVFSTGFGFGIAGGRKGDMGSQHM